MYFLKIIQALKKKSLKNPTTELVIVERKVFQHFRLKSSKILLGDDQRR